MVKFNNAILIVTILTVCIGCGRNDVRPTSSQGVEALSVEIPLGKVAVDVVSHAELVVSGPDMETVIAQLSIIDGLLTGSVVVPVGLRRLFEINAYDSNDNLTYSGKALADVVSGTNTNLPNIAVIRVNVATDVLPTMIEKTSLGGQVLRFLLVPNGYFVMGSEIGSSTAPEHQVYLDDYYVGEFEVTNSQFMEFLNEYGNVNREYSIPTADGLNRIVGPASYIYPGASTQVIIEEGGRFILHPDFPDYWDHPVESVLWFGASIFCKTIGARLPTEAEWEKAARGTDGRIFPWGNRYVEGAANTNAFNKHGQIAGVGSYPMDRSPYGAYDMVGNVQEMVSDWWDSEYYFFTTVRNPTGPEFGSSKTIRGGSFTQGSMSFLTTYARDGNGVEYVKSSVGFRCVCDPE
jgi:formylglycine-generating enzyme required for sulfatase activity